MASKMADSVATSSAWTISAASCDGELAASAASTAVIISSSTAIGSDSAAATAATVATAATAVTAATALTGRLTALEDGVEEVVDVAGLLGTGLVSLAAGFGFEGAGLLIGFGADGLAAGVAFTLAGLAVDSFFLLAINLAFFSSSFAVDRTEDADRFSLD